MIAEYGGDDKREEQGDPNTGKEKIKGEEFDDGLMLFSHWVCFVAISQLLILNWDTQKHTV